MTDNYNNTKNNNINITESEQTSLKNDYIININNEHLNNNNTLNNISENNKKSKKNNNIKNNEKTKKNDDDNIIISGINNDISNQMSNFDIDINNNNKQ